MSGIEVEDEDGAVVRHPWVVLDDSNSFVDSYTTERDAVRCARANAKDTGERYFVLRAVGVAAPKDPPVVFDKWRP